MPLLLFNASSSSRHSFVCILLHLLIAICMLLVMECFGDDTTAPRHLLNHHNLHHHYTPTPIQQQFATQRGVVQHQQQQQQKQLIPEQQEQSNSISMPEPQPHATRFIDIDIRDKIIEWQCLAKCGVGGGSGGNAPQICLQKCLIDAKKLPRRGNCSSLGGEQVNDLECMHTCSYDYDCPEVQKCCPSLCGPVCSLAWGVRDDVLLPEIPKIHNKLPRGNKVEITIVSAVNTTCYYHVEARSHIGLSFSPRKLGPWHWQPVEKIAEILDTRSKNIDVSFNAKPGRWYEVRVAAINAFGFRGYSETKRFTLQKRPKPPKSPADLKVVSTQANDKYFTVKIVWCPSKSNLPVEKYKVTWSLYVKSKENSLISNESFVKDAHQFLITKLLPDSSYYIQVQAISTIGRRRLKSEKTSVLFNTTSIKKTRRSVQPYEPLKCSTINHHDYRHFMPNSRKYSMLNFDNNNNYNKKLNIATITTTTTEPRQIETTIATTTTQQQNSMPYDVRFRMNRKLGMIVQISGFRPRKERVYELCPKEVSCEKREYSAIRAKKNSLEFSKLKYNTAYMLKAFCTEGDGNDNYTNEQIKPFNFTTPKCESFKKNFPKMEIQC